VKVGKGDGIFLRETVIMQKNRTDLSVNKESRLKAAFKLQITASATQRFSSGTFTAIFTLDVVTLSATRVVVMHILFHTVKRTCFGHSSKIKLNNNSWLMYLGCGELSYGKP
jgi:hypothetical protein